MKVRTLDVLSGIAAVVGAWLSLSPWILGYRLNAAAAGNAYAVGAILIFSNLFTVNRWVDFGAMVFNAVLGCWLIASYYVLGLERDTATAYNAIVVGAGVILLATAQIFAVRR